MNREGELVSPAAIAIYLISKKAIDRTYNANWTLWNHVRTVAAIAAAVSLTIALCYQGARS